MPSALILLLAVVALLILILNHRQGRKDTFTEYRNECLRKAVERNQPKQTRRDQAQDRGADLEWTRNK